MSARRAARRYGIVCLTAAVALLAVVAGCKGDGGGEPEDARDLLKQIALTLGDLPSPFTQTDQNFSTNEQVARGEEDIEGQLANLQRWGRLLGYDVTFEPQSSSNPQPIVAIRSTVSLYETAEGASQSFAYAVQAARDRDWAPSHTGFQNLQVQEIQRPGIADEIVWLRISGTTGEGADVDYLADDYVLIREDRARALVRVASRSASAAQSLFMLEQAADLAGIVVERVRTALG